MRDDTRAERLRTRARDRHESARTLLAAIRSDVHKTQVERFMKGLAAVESTIGVELQHQDWSEDDEATWLNGVELAIRIAELGLQSLERRVSSRARVMDRPRLATA